MPPELIAAVLQFAVKFGIEAAQEFLRHRGATIDDAIAALEKAQAKTLQEYKDEDLRAHPVAGLTAALPVGG